MNGSTLTRAELLRMFVLDAIADDYENLELISGHVTKLGAKCGLTILRSEVFHALAGLIKDGLASAYLIDRTAEKVQGMPPPDEVEAHYFWVTETGRELQLAEYPDWPFDEAGSLRENWSLGP